MRTTTRLFSVFAAGLATLVGAHEASAESGLCMHFDRRSMIFMQGPCGARDRIVRDEDRPRARPRPASTRPRYQHGRRCNSLDPRSGLMIPCFDN